MSAEADSISLISPVILLTAAVIAVPVIKRLGLSSVLGYLIAGLIIGPFGLAFFYDSASILHIAELGIVMYLFVIGLEMRPSHLWSLRKEIFGLGTLQIIACSIGLTGVGLVYGYSWQVSFVCAAGFVLTSTAIVMQLLGDRGDIAQPRGQKIVSILLFEDLLIVPLLAIVAFIAPNHVVENTSARLQSIGIGLISIAGLIAAGYWLLNPLFRLLAAAKAREVMAAAALLVVLGAALLMQISGLSMAMGAFLAGVLLSESTFRHQIEADIEPFRGILLGLFFLGVGMSLDLNVVKNNWPLILSAVIALMFVKAMMIFITARLTKSSHVEALDRALLMAQGGEFAFVLFAFAEGAGVIPAEVTAPLVVSVALSMAITPLLLMAGDWAMRRLESGSAEDRAPEIEEGHHDAIVAGYGRFGQIVGRMLSTYGYRISVLDHDADQVEVLRGFGRKVNYGDATRVDLLRLAGAAEAKLLIVAIDNDEKALELVETAREAFPNLKILARAIDRRHAYQLMAAKVDGLERETFAAAVRLGVKSLQIMGKPAFAAERAGMIFSRYDERALAAMFEDWQRVEFADYQRIVRDRTALEEELLKRDMIALVGKSDGDEWGEETLEREAFERNLAGKVKSD